MSKTYSIPQLAPIDEPPFNLLPLGTAEQLDRKAKDARAARIEAALVALLERVDCVVDRIDPRKRHKGVTIVSHVCHMAGHLEQHAKIARAALES